MWPFRKKNTDLDYISIWPEKELKKDEQGRYVSYESRRKNIQSKSKQRVNPNTSTRPKNTGDRSHPSKPKSSSCKNQPRNSMGQFMSKSNVRKRK